LRRIRLNQFKLPFNCEAFTFLTVMLPQSCLAHRNVALAYTLTASPQGGVDMIMATLN